MPLTTSRDHESGEGELGRLVEPQETFALPRRPRECPLLGTQSRVLRQNLLVRRSKLLHVRPMCTFRRLCLVQTRQNTSQVLGNAEAFSKRAPYVFGPFVDRQAWDSLLRSMQVSPTRGTAEMSALQPPYDASGVESVSAPVHRVYVVCGQPLHAHRTQVLHGGKRMHVRTCARTNSDT